MKILTIVFIFSVILFSRESNAQWEKIGPYGGTVTTFLASGNSFFAGTSTNFNGLYRSVDSGANWEYLSALPYINILALGALGKKIFAGTDQGVFSSTDDGFRWNWSDSGLKYITALTFAVSGAKIFAGTTGGLFLSNDSGKIWIPIAPKSMPLYVSALVVHNTDIFAATSAGVFHSADQGITWIYSGLSSHQINSLIFKGQDLFAATIDDGVYRSSDNGYSWINLKSGLISYNIHTLAADGKTIVAGTGESGAFRSTDNGETWLPANTGLNSANVLTSSYYGTKFFLGTDIGIFQSDNNGVNWYDANNGLATCNVLSLAVSHTEIPEIFAGIYGDGVNGVFRSPDHGKKWSLDTAGPTYKYIKSLTVIRENLFAGTVDSGVFRSTDWGKSWISVGLTNYNQVECMAVKGDNLYAAGLFSGGNVFRSTDYGNSWDSIGMGVQDQAVGMIFFGDNLFVTTANTGIYKSSDDGRNWISLGLINKSDFAQTFGIIGTYLFAGTFWSGQIYRSADSGKTWMKVSKNGTFYNVTSFWVHKNFIFAGTFNGVFRSADSGVTWIPVNSGLGDLAVMSLVADNLYLYAGTGAGVWRHPLPDLLDVPSHPDDQTLSQISLEQNYPNPFSAETTIKFSLLHSDDITLKIFDELGKEVAMIRSGYFQAGNYTADWDAGRLSSGNYYIRLLAGKFVITRRMVVTK